MVSFSLSKHPRLSDSIFLGYQMRSVPDWLIQVAWWVKRRDIMYDDLSEEGDDYRKDFQRGVEAIEKYLKPKLHY